MIVAIDSLMSCDDEVRSVSIHFILGQQTIVVCWHCDNLVSSTSIEGIHDIVSGAPGSYASASVPAPGSSASLSVGSTVDDSSGVPSAPKIGCPK